MGRNRWQEGGQRAGPGATGGLAEALVHTCPFRLHLGGAQLPLSCAATPPPRLEGGALGLGWRERGGSRTSVKILLDSKVGDAHTVKMVHRRKLGNLFALTPFRGWGAACNHQTCSGVTGRFSRSCSCRKAGR